MLYILGTLLLVAVAVIGISVLCAGRQLVDGESDISRSAHGVQHSAQGGDGFAGVVDGSVRRVRVAVAELIATDVHHDDLRPSAAEFSRRGHDYTVLGFGLVGLAGALLVGLLLVLWVGLLCTVRDALRAQLWPLPTLAAGVLMPRLDAHIDSTMPDGLGWLLFVGETGAARTAADAVGSSMITVTSLTSLLAVVTLQLASGQFSPRRLRNFTSDLFA